MCISFTTYNLHAALALGNIIVDIPSTTPKADIEVYNRSQQPMAIAVDVKEIINPGQETQQSLNILADEDFTNDSLIIDPSMFILAASEKRLLRFMNLNTDITTDKIYRVSVTPKENINPKLQAQEGVSAGVKILLAYEVLAIIRPSEIEYNVEYTRVGNKLKLTNKGNSNIIINSVANCEYTPVEHCSDIPAIRLYAGMHTSIDLAYATPVSISYSNHTNKTIDIPFSNSGIINNNGFTILSK